MSHNIVEVSSFDANITVPDDGDVRNAASVVTAFQSLSNRTKFLNTHAQATTTEVRAMESGWVPITAGGFAMNAAGTGFTDALNTGSTIHIPLHLPHGQTLTNITVYLTAAGAHAGLPATMPTVFLFSQLASTGATTTIGTYADASASTAAYQAYHSISSGAISQAIDRSLNRYFLTLKSEFGANALAGLQVWSAYATWTRTTFGND